MDRREFLEAIAGISALGPTLVFAQELHARAQAAVSLHTLNALQDATVTCIADLLLPQTDSVGASSVGVNRFIDLLLTESLPQAHRERFLAGLAAIDARSQALNGAPFATARRPQQESLLRLLDVRARARNPALAESAAQAGEAASAEDGFAVLKRLVVFAYFTSEPVAKELINAPIIPGRYDGCVPV
jgi:hypothetical protein